MIAVDTKPNTVAGQYRKVFVVGCPRSGTSWTSEMLGKHPSIVRLPGETHVYKLLYDPFTYLKEMSFDQRIRQVPWILRNYGINPIIKGFDSRSLWAGMPRAYKIYERSGRHSGPHIAVDYKEFLDLVDTAKSGEESDLIKVKRLIASIFDSAFYREGGDTKKIMLEKTPMHVKFSDVILESFPEAKAIEIVRDIRGLCASWQALAKSQKWARRSVEDLTHQWVKAIEFGNETRRNSDLSDRIIRVRYEDLRQDTAHWLKTIFDFIEIDIEAQQLNDIIAALDIRNAKKRGEGQHIRNGIVDSWKEELSAEDIDTCHRIAGPLLDQLDYDVS